MFNRSKTLTAITGCLALLACGGLSLAGKGGNGGGGNGGGGRGGGGETPPGIVLFSFFSWETNAIQTLTMNADGTGKQPLPIDFGFPSHELHAGWPWFLQMREIPGEIRPDGDPRYELFAVRGDGDEQFTVQLTDQHELQPEAFGFNHDGNWVPGDGLISFRAVRWDLATGEALGGRIYLAVLDFDSDGNILGLAEQPDPDAPAVPVPLAEPTANDSRTDRMILSGFSWSSDGRLAWASDDRLYVTDYLYAPETDNLIAEGDSLADPAWSPDDSRIAFSLSRDIVSVRPDGTEGTVILPHLDSGKASSTLEYPEWSPDGNHLVCRQILYEQKGPNWNVSEDVVRFRSDGSDREPVNLTGDLEDGQAIPLGWR